MQFPPDLLEALEAKIIARIQVEIDKKIEMAVGKRFQNMMDI